MGVSEFIIPVHPFFFFKGIRNILSSFFFSGMQPSALSCVLINRNDKRNYNMKTHRFLACLSIIASLFFTANATEKIEGNGTIVTKEFSVGPYDGIEVGGMQYGTRSTPFSFMKWEGTKGSAAPMFYYTQGKTNSLTVTTDKNIMPHLKVRVIDKVLTIRTEDGYGICPTKFLMRGTSTDLKSIKMTGGGHFYIDSYLKGDEMDAFITGGGNLHMDNPIVLEECNLKVTGGGNLEAKSLSCKEINVKITGGGDAFLQGKAEEGNVIVTGGGDLHAYGFEVKEYEVSVTGGGRAEVFTTEKLDARVTGGGDLYYKGTPKEKTTSTTGGGNIRAVK